MKIEKLTPEHEAQIPVIRDEFIRHGLSTEPADFDSAEQAIKDAYAVAGLSPPNIFIRLRSPHEGAIGAAILKETNLGTQVWDQVRAQVRAQVWDQVYGAHDSEWLAFYDFMLSELKIKECKKLNGLMELARYCGWWAPYENAVILQDRPSKIKFDDQKRLHSEDGPSIEYRDGFSVYSWHGTRIPEAWIKSPNELTPEIALTHENVEQRRAACEILGWETILNKLNAITIDRDEDPLVGELVEVDIPEIGREKFLRVTCGTGRKFALPVPPEMKTALQSNAWTYGLDGCEYNPEIRT